MPRFFFHFRRGREREADDIGLTFASLEAAYLDTFAAARDIWSEMVRDREDPSAYAFEIADERGLVLIEVPLQEVMASVRRDRDRQPMTRFVNPGASRAKRLSGELAAEIETAQAQILESREILRRSRRFQTV